MSYDYLEERRQYMEELSRREDELQKGRVRLREVYALAAPDGPANPTKPAFVVGPADTYAGPVVDRLDPAHGNLSDRAAQTFKAAMVEAATTDNPLTRDVAVSRAANAVSQDVARHNRTGFSPTDQVAFSARGLRDMLRDEVVQLGRSAGLGPLQTEALAHTLQRTLEREGLKTLANTALDGASRFAASASSITVQMSQRFHLEKAGQYLASHGITTDKLKELVGRHAGKAVTLMHTAEHADTLGHAAKQLVNSGITLQGVARVVGDKAVQSAVGDIAVNSGQALSGVPGMRAAGSISIVAGSLLKGESTEELGKHVLRATGAIAGGALGAVGGVFGAVVGAEVGAAAADKLISFYEEKFEKPGLVAHRDHNQEKTLITDATEQLNRAKETKDDLRAGSSTVHDRLETAMRDRGFQPDRELIREYTRNQQQAS